MARDGWIRIHGNLVEGEVTWPVDADGPGQDCLARLTSEMMTSARPTRASPRTSFTFDAAGSMPWRNRMTGPASRTTFRFAMLTIALLPELRGEISPRVSTPNVPREIVEAVGDSGALHGDPAPLQSDLEQVTRTKLGAPADLGGDDDLPLAAQGHRSFHQVRHSTTYLGPALAARP